MTVCWCNTLLSRRILPKKFSIEIKNKIKNRERLKAHERKKQVERKLSGYFFVSEFGQKAKKSERKQMVTDIPKSR